MKRSPMSPRKTPLTSSKPLSRGSSLPRSPLVRKAPEKPVDGVRRSKTLSSARPKQTAEERRARKAVRARSGSTCEVCGRAPMTNFQHRKAAVHGGPWCPSNGLAVCGMGNVSGCHGRIHQGPRVAYERGWSVRSGHDPAEQPVWLAGRGWSYLTPDGQIVPAERSAA